MKTGRVLLAGLAAVLLCGTFTATARGAEESQNTGFPPEVGAIFQGNCVVCHSGQSKLGGLVLETRDDLLKGGAHGAAIVAGNPEASRMVQMLEGKLQPQMPMGGELKETEIAAIKAWIHSGAPRSNVGRVSATVSVPSIPDIRPTVDVSPQVGALAFSPDGKRLAVGGYREVRILNVADGSEWARLEGHAEVVRGVAFSPDGKLLAAAGGLPARSGEVKIWNLETREPVHTIQAHDDCIYAVAFSPDGNRVATGSYDKLIYLWDVETGKQVKRLKDHIDAVFSLAFSADGKWLASAAQDSSVKIWDAASGERLYTLSEPLDSLYSLTFHPSGRRLAAGGVDKVIRVWDLTRKGGNLVQSMIGHEAAILRTAFSPDGKTLITAAEDGMLKIWDAETLTERKVVSGQSDWVMALEFDPEGDRLAVGRYDGSVSLYETTSYRETARMGFGKELELNLQMENDR